MILDSRHETTPVANRASQKPPKYANPLRLLHALANTICPSNCPRQSHSIKYSMLLRDECP